MTTTPTVANELRKDYLIDRWTVIATARKKRPTDFKRTPQENKQGGVCALEPGNEHMTPPAVLVYLPTPQGGIKKDRDLDGERHRGWFIRCVPNLYPAFMPPKNNNWREPEKEAFACAIASGHHEVLVESPKHDEHPSVSAVSQLTLVVNAYIDRLRDLSSKPYVKYVSIFRNHGLEAGASLSHAHSQIIATPMMPTIVKEEVKASQEILKNSQNCAFCSILENEKQSPRFIWKNEHFVIIAPWASIHPFEFWVFPRNHQCCLLDLSQEEVQALAKTMRLSLGGLRTLLGDPPYNFGFHQVTSGAGDYYHWHLEVYPRLSIWAGFEKSTGMYINVVSPEDAAQSLRDAIKQEESRL